MLVNKLFSLIKPLVFPPKPVRS